MNQYLQRLIEEGEHQQQDFKYCINDSKKIAKTLVAFANTSGGRLLIGVKDNGKVVGISSDEEIYMVETAAKIFSNPGIDYYINQLKTDGKTVLDVFIKPGNKKPYFARDESGKWLAYIRVEDENIVAHPVQIEVWNKQSSPEGIHFTYSDNEKFLIHLLKEKKEISFSEYFREAGIPRDETEEILANFIIMGIVKIITSKTSTLFYLNDDFDLTHYMLF